MRSFRFRLDPVIRLKKYEIERKESEIAEIDQTIHRILEEIEDGRQHVLEMRRRLMEDVSDEDYIREEQSLDLFQHYMKQVEAKKREEITAHEEEKAKKRAELLGLYQEDKILERYKEKKQTEWKQETMLQENKQMDEIGIQNYLRNNKNRGGVLLYLIVPLVLIAAAVGVGIYTKTIDREMLSKIPYVRDLIGSATDTGQILSSTAEEDITLTMEEVLNARPDMTMDQVLQNLQERIVDLNTLQQQLSERERDIAIREQTLERNQQQISDDIQFASQQIETLREEERLRLEREQSELSQNEVTFSAALKKMDAKQAATLLADTYIKLDDPTLAAPPPAVDPNTGKKILTDNQKTVLRIMHLLDQKQMTEFLSAMTKNAQTKDTATELFIHFNNTTMDDLLDIEPTPTPKPQGNVNPASGTASTGNTNLPPPQQRSAGS